VPFKIETIKTNRDDELNGVWADDLPDGLRLKVARMGNDRYNQAVSKRAQSHLNAVGEIDMDDESQVAELAEVYADTILMDWEGLEENGETVPCTRENRVRLMLEYPDFFRIVRRVSMQADLFRRAAQKEDQGNSN
jgi:hypothetical protein